MNNFNTELETKKYLPNLPNKIDDTNIQLINTNFDNYKNEITKDIDNIDQVIIDSVIANLFQFINYVDYITFGINNNLEKARQTKAEKRVNL